MSEVTIEALQEELTATLEFHEKDAKDYDVAGAASDMLENLQPKPETMEDIDDDTFWTVLEIHERTVPRSDVITAVGDALGISDASAARKVREMEGDDYKPRSRRKYSLNERHQFVDTALQCWLF